MEKKVDSYFKMPDNIVFVLKLKNNILYKTYDFFNKQINCMYMYVGV